LPAEVLLAPRHPYTQALIAALPDINVARHSGPEKEPNQAERARLPAVVPAHQPAAREEPLVTVSNLTKRYHRKGRAAGRLRWLAALVCDHASCDADA
jgi:ABC-type glutathione transport system ATPase component